MHRRMASLLFLVVALELTAKGSGATEQRPMFLGSGGFKCEKWLDERQKKASILEFGMEGWLTGFVSGISNETSLSATSVEQTFLFDTDEADFLKRIDKFCRDQPNSYLIQAGLFVAGDLMVLHATRIKDAMEHQKN
jgi:hypothetical protein